MSDDTAYCIQFSTDEISDHSPCRPSDTEQARRVVFHLVMLALAVFPIEPVSAAAQVGAPVVSRYSDLAPGSCGPAQHGTPGDHESMINRCRLLGAFKAETGSHGTYVTFTLSGGGATARLGAGYAVGDRLEWRGLRIGERFEPRAAILRLASRDPEGQVRSALAVLRIDDGRPCYATVLDGNGTDANARARTIADGLMETFRCGIDRPAIAGPEIFAAQEVMDRAH